MARTIILEKFNSLADFTATIGRRQNNSVFANSFSSEKGSSNFTGTKSYQESIELISRGYSDGLSKINSDNGERINYRRVQSKRIPRASVVGYAPIVPNAIIGLPTSMIADDRIQHKAKVVSIWYDSTADCGVSVSEIAKAGRHLLELVSMLEGQGFRVELCMVNCMNGSTESCICSVKVKTDRQPMNPLKIAYPLIHASFLRRQGFKWLETHPAITDTSLNFGYGTPLYHHVHEGDRREWMKKHNVLEPNCFFTDFYEAKDNDATQLMKLMNLK